MLKRVSVRASAPAHTSPTSVRSALLVLALGGFGIATGEFVTLGLLPQFAASLHASIPSAGHLISAYALGVVVGAPLVTAAVVRLPRKTVLVVLAVLLAAGNVASALMPGMDSLLVVRFLSGLPHGAYFGVASVVAAGMVEPRRRSSAMATVFAGLTVANIVGVPLTTLLGQHLGWRLVFVLIGALELVAALAVALVVPASDPAGAAAPRLRHELRAFRQWQVWLSLGIATIGGGAMFATFSYIAPMMTQVTGFADSTMTPLLVLFGVGMTAGNLLGARLADRALMPTVCLALTAEAVVAALFLLTVHNRVAAAVTIVLFPMTALAVLPALQSRLVGLAGGAPNLAAASIHAAFNIANSIGAWLGGLTIAAGYGYASPNAVAAGLAVLGVLVALASVQLDRTRRRRAQAAADPLPVPAG
jgi:MFS transporter, DHA1 family, inner membrane transport protein